MKGYILLSIAIVSEVLATLCLKLSDGFSNIIPSIGVVFGYGLAFYLLSQSLAYMSLSLAYAVWSGVGTALTAILGILVFSDPLSFWVILGVVCIILGVVLLNTSKATSEEEAT
ncbi:DMT family transporter [Lederbergia ruris]|uniref:DMT family transporter n=1 Tax=Lederbergia ruris TaxID=217495 RepID=UPI0039A11248